MYVGPGIWSSRATTWWRAEFQISDILKNITAKFVWIEVHIVGFSFSYSQFLSLRKSFLNFRVWRDSRRNITLSYTVFSATKRGLDYQNPNSRFSPPVKLNPSQDWQGVSLEAKNLTPRLSFAHKNYWTTCDTTDSSSVCKPGIEKYLPSSASSFFLPVSRHMILFERHMSELCSLKPIHQ